MRDPRAELTTSGGLADAVPLRRELLRVAFSSGAYVAADGLARGVALSLSLLYTHFVAPNELGALAITGTATLLLSSVLGLSISAGVSRLYFECRSDTERQQLYASSIGFLLVGPTVFVLVIEVVGRTGAFDIFAAAPYAPYLRYAVITAYFSLFLDLASSIFIVARRPLMVFVLSIANAVLLLGLSLGFVVVAHQRVLGILRAGALTAGLTGLVAGVLVLRLARWRVTLSRRWLRPALIFSVPLIPHAVAQWILQVSDRPIIARYVPGVEVGIYYLGYSIGAIAGLATHGVSRAIGPVVTRDLKADRRGRVIRVGTYWFAVMAVGCLIVALFGRDLLGLVVPANYAGATRVVPVVAFAHVGFAAYMIVAQGIWFAMRTRWVPLLTFAAGAANVALNVLLVPRYGIIAAAWDTVIGFAVLAVLNAVVAHRLYRIDWEYVRWAKVTAAVLVAYAFAQIAGAQPSVARLGLEVVGIVVVLPLTLTVLLFWSPSERSMLRRRFPLFGPGS